MRKFLKRTLGITIIGVIAASWTFSGWPRIYNFPPKVLMAEAAAPAFKSFSSGAMPASTGADITISLPTHAANDIMLILGWVRDTNDSVTITTATGWSELATWDRGTSSRYWLFWKRALSSSETNPVFNKSGTTGDTYAAAIVYSGATTNGNPWEVVGAASTGTTDPATITGITTLSTSSLVVVAVGGEDDINGGITTTGTNPTAYTEHYIERNTGSDGAISFSEAERTSPGATGNVSVDWDVQNPVGWGGRVLALKPLSPTFDQSAYRFYSNADSTDVGAAFAGNSTSTTLGSTGLAFRLRVLLHVAVDPLAISDQAFKLQFVDKGGGTCASPSGGTPSTYTDVTDSTAIAYNDNATPADGDALTSNGNDPSHGSDALSHQTYEELNNFTNSVSAISSSTDGHWDFSLKDNAAPASTTYCFRIVKSDGAVLTYSVYPELTSAAAATVSCSTDVSTVSLGTILPGAVAISSTNASTTMTCTGGTGCSLYVRSANAGLATSSPAYTINSGTATLVAGTEGYGINATTTSAGSGALLGLNTTFGPAKWNTNQVGALALGNTLLASSTSASTNREVLVQHRAAIAGNTPPATYTDTITYECLGN